MKKVFVVTLIVLVGLGILFRFTCGIFVVQPIGMLPKGTTIIYWRTGLNLPFISSADGLLSESGMKVSLLSRGMMLGEVVSTIKEKEIMRIAYSEWLFNLSMKEK
jgi:hypothetical protein